MPTVTEQLAILTTSVDNLTSAVNVQKVVLDTAVLNAANSATASANSAITSSTFASAAANSATASANSAVASANSASTALIASSQIQTLASLMTGYDSNIVFLTWTEYQALVTANTVNVDTFYAITT